jgi:hypothetical protein
MRSAILFFYIGRIDYVWIGDEKMVSPTPGTLPRINNMELQRLLESDPGRRIWLVTDPFRIEKLKRESKNSLVFLNHIAECMVYKGQDGQTAVYLMSPAKKRATRRVEENYNSPSMSRTTCRINMGDKKPPESKTGH